MKKLSLSLPTKGAIAITLAVLSFAISLYQSSAFILGLNRYLKEDPYYFRWMYLNREELITLIGASICLGLTWYGKQKRWSIIINLIWVMVILFFIGIFTYDRFIYYLLSVRANSQDRHYDLLFLQDQLKYHWYLPVIFLLYIGLLITQWRDFNHSTGESSLPKHVA